jgi:hypothetical protein
MPNGVAMSDMSETGCTSCGKATGPASCEAVCIALPGLEPEALDLHLPSPQAPWTLSSEGGATHFIAPDPSPPRPTLSRSSA